eukprot:TRINITY_DN1887_c0_g1_i6.p1 TRINITY_DN1887_c0_g1~~TRINITY_DN1887_c0_g1_i6.p1  ORF type:complete len:233 (-),score=51.99 TRINITY_DN1887_c0_g1_i6:219-917(-)
MSDKKNFSFSFTGKTALITGARGIGKEIALMLARSGASLVVAARTESDLQSLKEEVNKINGHDKGIKIIQADIGKIEDCQRIITEAGPIDLLVNNAAICQLAPFVETSAESFETHMNVNVRAPMLISQGIAKGMIERKKGGSIVNISSQASKIGLEGHTAYCVSKGALDQLTRMMALELGPHNIRVNSVNPTVVLTEMAKVGWSKKEKAEPHLKRIPLGRFAQPEEVIKMKE